MSDTANFLETLLWVGEENRKPTQDWTIHQFHPEFVAALDGFLQGFRAYLETLDIDPDDCERSFGGNVFFSLSGHGCGFWDDWSDHTGELGKACHAALEAYSGSKYRFEELEHTLAKFHGKIHLAYRTAAFRREYLAALFTPATPAPAIQ